MRHLYTDVEGESGLYLLTISDGAKHIPDEHLRDMMLDHVVEPPGLSGLCFRAFAYPGICSPVITLSRPKDMLVIVTTVLEAELYLIGR